MKKTVQVIILISVLLVFLAGCSNGSGQLKTDHTINSDLTIDVPVNGFTARFAGPMFESSLSQHGFVVERKEFGNKTHYLVRKHFDSLQDFKNLAQSSKNNFHIQKEEHFFFTIYKVDGHINLQKFGDQFNSSQLAEQLLQPMLQKSKVKFQITLPVNAKGENNADFGNGKSLGWILDFQKPASLAFTFRAPNAGHIILFVAAFLIIGGIIIVLFVMKKKSKR